MVRIEDRHPIGMEALVRLQLSRQGMLFPGDFLPQIEEAGLSAILTDAIARLALSDWSGLPGPSGRPVLSINFPLDVLLSPIALAQLDERRHEAGLPADVVLIELTESRPVDDLQGLEYSLQRIREAGYATALDDITPKLPHLQSLMRMPFDMLKLDKGVVRAGPRHPDAAAFIASIVRHADAHAMTVTAEGVEDQDTWDTMHGLGVHAAQGYLIHEPMRAVSISNWLTDWAGQLPS
jgi:EAL domain-containing protein (putative c-di-GMP-specific phosphodiesterase class I)